MKAKSVGFGRRLKEPTERQAIENALLEHAQEEAQDTEEVNAVLDHLAEGTDKD